MPELDVVSGVMISGECFDTFFFDTVSFVSFTR